MPKVMVVMPEDLLKQVDGAARGAQTNRSAFICHSLRAQLRTERLRQLRRRILEDARAIGRDFREYWIPADEPMWMAAENEALRRVEEGGFEYDPDPVGRPFLAQLDPIVGSEQSGTRPVLVLQSDLANRYFRTILSAPISASPKAHQRAFTVHIAAGEGGLPRDSVVLVFQIRTLDRARFIKRIGHLPARRMVEVERAILICLGMEHLLV